MAVLTDNFTTDTSANWAHSGGAAFFPTSDVTWDTGAGELVVDYDSQGLGRYTTETGSLEHEVQLTVRMPSTTLEHSVTGSPRMNSGDGYFLAPASDYRAALARFNGGSITVLRYVDLATGSDFATGDTATEPDPSDWVTVRLAAEGSVGGNVTLSLWWVVHGASKPASDPGWIGTDGSPQFVYVDSDANRLDDSVHNDVGIAGLQNTTSTRADWWKARNISDRSPGAAANLHYRRR